MLECQNKGEHMLKHMDLCVTVRHLYGLTTGISMFCTETPTYTKIIRYGNHLYRFRHDPVPNTAKFRYHSGKTIKYRHLFRAYSDIQLLTDEDDSFITFFSGKAKGAIRDIDNKDHARFRKDTKSWKHNKRKTKQWMKHVQM